MTGACAPPPVAKGIAPVLAGPASASVAERSSEPVAFETADRRRCDRPYELRCKANAIVRTPMDPADTGWLRLSVSHGYRAPDVVAGDHAHDSERACLAALKGAFKVVSHHPTKKM